MKEIERVLKNEPPFRIKQAKSALFCDLINSWDDATALPRDLRLKLESAYPLPEIKLEKILESRDLRTGKALFFLEDGRKIESVLMIHPGRNTVCVSSQVGCAMGCGFCATGRSGFKRNLADTEIVGQVLFFARRLKKLPPKKLIEVEPRPVSGRKGTVERVTNVVFMGMGEALLNYDNVMSSIRILNDKDGFNLGARRISISTCGIVEGIKKLSKEPLQVNLAISLNAPNDALRSTLMPINKKYPIEKILAAVKDYAKKTKRRVMFEYLMIDGVNDGQKNAVELANLLRDPLIFVNLISFNPVGHSEFRPSPGWRIKKFKEVLESRGVDVTQRYRFGNEIKAACGQLAGESNLLGK